LQLRAGNIILNAEEMSVVPKGIKHCSKAEPDTHFMMVEPSSTAHKGNQKRTDCIIRTTRVDLADKSALSKIVKM
jgi:hypothetical protein